MTTEIENLLDSTFYMMYYLHMSPSEVDNLTTYEMRKYLNMLNERRKAENESESSIIKIFLRLLGVKNFM